MELILPILCIALGAWLIISPLVYIYWHFNGNVRRQYEEHLHAVFLGTLVTFTILIGAGLTQLLVFLLGSWGNLDQSVFFVRTRGYIGFTLGLLAAIQLTQSMSRREAVDDKKRALCHELEVNRHTSELGYLNLLKPSDDRSECDGLQGEWADSMSGSPVRLRNMKIDLMCF